MKAKRQSISLNGSPTSESFCVMQRKVANTVQMIHHQVTVPPLPVPFSSKPRTAGRSAIAVRIVKIIPTAGDFSCSCTSSNKQLAIHSSRSD